MRKTGRRISEGGARSSLTRVSGALAGLVGIGLNLFYVEPKESFGGWYSVLDPALVSSGRSFSCYVAAQFEDLLSFECRCNPKVPNIRYAVVPYAQS